MGLDHGDLPFTMRSTVYRSQSREQAAKRPKEAVRVCQAPPPARHIVWVSDIASSFLARAEALYYGGRVFTMRKFA